jgi:predicted CXXCH cytochrome family protein
MRRGRGETMSPTRRLFIGAIILITAASGYAAGRAFFRPSERIRQPIAFNHEKHVEELGLECSTCHEFYETGRHAGLPSLGTCLQCHDDPDTDKAELKKVLDLSAKGKDEVFHKLFRLADHVFYSHRRHAAIEGIPCETCHGAIAKTTSPPERPLVRITMDFCLDCHQRKGASQECTHCHR